MAPLASANLYHLCAQAAFGISRLQRIFDPRSDSHLQAVAVPFAPSPSHRHQQVGAGYHSQMGDLRHCFTYIMPCSQFHVALFLTEVAIWGVHSTSGKPICTLRVEENENKSWNMIKFIFCYNKMFQFFLRGNPTVLLKSPISFYFNPQMISKIAMVFRADLPTSYGKIP